MGMISDECSEHSETATAKPKERQFQVVPVPGVFTRGRWKCWDYKDSPPVDGEILNFPDKPDKVVLPATVSVVEQQVVPNLDQGTVGDALPHTVSEPQFSVSSNDLTNNSASSSQADVTTVKEVKESSTIVVTSIGPAPVTPVLGAVDPTSGLDSNRNVTTVPVQFPSSTLTILNEGEPNGQSSVVSPMSVGGSTATVVSSGLMSVGSVSPQDGVPAAPLGAYVVPPAATGLAAPSNTGVLQASGAAFPEATIPAVAAMAPAEGVQEDLNVAGSTGGGPNVVAIDNKIEQAMDLVKTHLTFAVREEVEILRSTIVDLETRVAQLESQNQVLKQFAPAEVVANLALLVQNAQQQKQLPGVSSAPCVSMPANSQPVSPPQPAVLNTLPPVRPANMAPQQDVQVGSQISNPTVAQHSAVTSMTQTTSSTTVQPQFVTGYMQQTNPTVLHPSVITCYASAPGVVQPSVDVSYGQPNITLMQPSVITSYSQPTSGAMSQPVIMSYAQPSSAVSQPLITSYAQANSGSVPQQVAMGYAQQNSTVIPQQLITNYVPATAATVQSPIVTSYGLSQPSTVLIPANMTMTSQGSMGISNCKTQVDNDVPRQQ